ncbi:MAG: hypothetical protein P8Y65_07390 [Campylobacterales bacterium]|jgi:hypothetical protein
MAEGLLSKDEIDALMSLFGSEPPVKKKAPTRRKEGVDALKADLEAKALRWAAALKALTGCPSNVSLRTIVKTSRIAVDDTHLLLRCARRERFLLVPQSLVNLVNEKSLGALEPTPMLSHPLSEIDRELFETTGRLFSEEGVLKQEDALTDTGPLYEARFDLEVETLLRTTVRMVIRDQPV